MISLDESKIMSHYSRGREEHHHCRTQRRTQRQKSRKCKIQESYCSSKSLCWRSHKCSYCLQRHSRICNVNHPSDIINVSIFLILDLSNTNIWKCSSTSLYRSDDQIWRDSYFYTLLIIFIKYNWSKKSYWVNNGYFWW